MATKIRFVPKSRTVLGIRNLLNCTHETMCLYQDYLVDEFLQFMKKDGEVLTFRRLLTEARECFGRYSGEIKNLNPNRYSEAEGKEMLVKLLTEMKRSYQMQNQMQKTEESIS